MFYNSLLLFSLLTLCADIYAFVVLKDGVTDGAEAIEDSLQQLIRKHIGGFAVPQRLLVSIW